MEWAWYRFPLETWVQQQGTGLVFVYTPQNSYSCTAEVRHQQDSGKVATGTGARGLVQCQSDLPPQFDTVAGRDSDFLNSGKNSKQDRHRKHRSSRRHKSQRGQGS